MKKLLSILILSAMVAPAAPLVQGVVSAGTLEAIASYDALETCMRDMAAVLAAIKDEATAETQAPALRRAAEALKAKLAEMDDPYRMWDHVLTKDDSRAMVQCRKRLQAAGMAVQGEMLRLVRAEFYHSAPLITTLQELEMLNSDTSALIK